MSPDSSIRRRQILTGLPFNEPIHEAMDRRQAPFYLMDRLKTWGFRVGCIRGGMKAGSREEPGTRLYTEQQFREGTIQALVATEAAGGGINLQCCHICSTQPQLQEPVSDPARFQWRAVRKVKPYWMDVDAITCPMRIREALPDYGGEE